MAMKEVFQNTIQKMMSKEFDNFMGYEKNDNKVQKENYRNGFSKKNVNSQYGQMEIYIPRDREAKFEPIIIKKYERDIFELVDMVFALYSRGMSTRDVGDFMFSKYSVNYSPAQISQLTNEIVEDARLWQERKLETYYPVIYIDAVHFHVVNNNVVTKKATYVIMGINGEGQKEIPGLYIGENEYAKFWMSVLNALKKEELVKLILFKPGQKNRLIIKKMRVFIFIIEGLNYYGKTIKRRWMIINIFLIWTIFKSWYF
ncbi:IS256 family transposase [Metamycoplasma hominis]|uniref:IS256 family transposase n=1 Tax=Metamycoplasma hominis TaxID=2098 RepID=UPI003CEF35C1